MGCRSAIDFVCAIRLVAACVCGVRCILIDEGHLRGDTATDTDTDPTTDTHTVNHRCTRGGTNVDDRASRRYHIVLCECRLQCAIVGIGRLVTMVGEEECLLGSEVECAVTSQHRLRLRLRLRCREID